MKAIFLFIIIIFSSSLQAWQCPPIKNFYQDKNQIWHLSKTQPAPDNTYWESVTQGPLGSKYHKLNTFNVDLTNGTYLDRVNCFYGLNGNIFMGINLHVTKNLKPIPAAGAVYDNDMPNECIVSPENCEFVLVSEDALR